MSRSSRAIIAMAVILLLCASTASVAAVMNRASVPARAGMGAQGTASASSTTHEAWIYTGDFRNTTPEKVSGTVGLTASKGAATTQDRATVTAQFTWQGDAYKVHITGLHPTSGEDFPGHGPVQYMRPVLGTTDLGTLNLPATHAHVAVYGRATVSKNGKYIAENQPAIVLVAEAIHGSDQTLLSTPETSRTEFAVIVPGPINGQKFVKGFPNGYFYIYWPDTTYKLSGNARPTPTPASIPTLTGKGPATPMLGTETPRGTIHVSLTSTGIKKQMGVAPTGLYDLKITNNTSRARGLLITGIDLCCTEYTRFSQLIPPGGSQLFRWYFAPGKVRFRDFTGGVRTATSWMRVKYGGHSSSIIFSSM